MLLELEEQYDDTQRDINQWEMERINLISYCQMTEFMDEDNSSSNLSSITDSEKKKVLIKQSIKSFDIYQILEKKRYYMGEVTFVDGTMVSFVINTYSKLVRYLDGRKMEYEFIRSILREDMKPTYYKKKTDGTSSRSYNTPQPDSFFPHERY